MAKAITSDNSIIILMVATSAGEVDWILPVLKAFMEKNEDWRLVTIFGHKLVFDRFVKTNPILFKEFSEISSMNILPQEMDSLSSDKIDPENIKVIFKDYNRDEFAPFKTQVEQQFSNAIVVSYPHSCHIYSNRQKDLIQHCKNPDEFSKHDLFLLGSENDIPHWSASVDVKKIRALGTPRYDEWWVNRFLKDPDLEKTKEFRLAQEADRVFFYVSRGEHPHYLSKPDYNYLVKSIAESVFSYENSLMIIKPHPRQDIDELFKLLSPYDSKRYIVSGMHLFQLAHISDVVISGWSSGILDALAVGKPVIEFWRFGGRDPLCRRDDQGNYTTIYREFGLAAPADTKEELDALLQSALEEPDAPTWKSQQEAFKKQCRFKENASKEIVKAIEVELGKGSSGQVHQTDSLDAISKDKQDEIVDTIIGFTGCLLEIKQVEKAREWLVFLYEQFPDDPNVLNNLSIFLFNQGDVDSAVKHLVECMNLHPDFNDAAVNLVQILLIVGRTEDALDIVVSRYSKPENEVSKTMFLKALADQLSEDQFMLVRQQIAQMRS